MESAREMEERFAVTAATGALGPVLVKLAALLGAEYKLLEGTRLGIESIKSELEPVHHLLGKLWGREDHDVACKDWMAEAREMSYEMEDGIDHFTLGLERDDGSFIQLETTDDGPLKEFMERVKDVSKQCGKIGDTNPSNRSKLTTDPRAFFLHRDASELVGMKGKRMELINLLDKHETVCVVGFAGMGKTTLADLVYQKIGDQFQCRAFVSLHRSPNLTDVLGTILSQVTDGEIMSAGSGTEPAAEQNIVNDISISLSEKSGTEPAAEQNNFIEVISNFLSDKRYMVIIDDIWHWEEWEVIRKALPKNNLSCKLIMTTRLWSIAEKCRTEQGAHVYVQKFGRAEAARLSAIRLSKSVEGTNVKVLSTMFVDMCDGPPFDRCPLAVICLSSAWLQDDHGEWATWNWDTLHDGFMITPSLKPLVQSLCLGFDDLPAQLRTCLLYCTVYPARFLIHMGHLVRKWIAEGFVSQVEVAETYLEELVSRNLLQCYRGNYLIHSVMRAFLVCKAKEDNFIAYYHGPGDSSRAKQIHRLSFSTDRYPDEDVLSHTRSFFAYGKQCQLDGVLFKAFKKLRVLEITYCSRLQNGHLVDICGLIWLKYLGIFHCDRITELPREIGRLQNLETLHVTSTQISKLPTEIRKLQHLESLDVSRTKVTELPTWIEKLQSLKTLNVCATEVTELPREIRNLERLKTLDISQTRVRELPKEIGKLQHLRTLDIRGTKVRELSCSKDPNPLFSVVFDSDRLASLKVMSPLCVISSSGSEEVISSSQIEVLMLFNHFGPEIEVLPVAMLRVAWRHMKVPQWVKQDLRNVCSLDIRLCKLVEEDLEFLKQMPNLQALQLRFEVLPREPVAITGGGFSKLETFYVDSRLPRVITFQEGAMPKLKYLEFVYYTGTASKDYSMGITRLQNLKNVVFRCSEYYRSDGPGISATIEVVRKEAAEHPNEITLWVDDKEPEVFGSGAKWISQADKAIIAQREQLYDAAKRRASLAWRERYLEQREQLYDTTSDYSSLEEMEESDHLLKC